MSRRLRERSDERVKRALSLRRRRFTLAIADAQGARA